jgi:hypothetical protein
MAIQEIPAGRPGRTPCGSGVDRCGVPDVAAPTEGLSNPAGMRIMRCYIPLEGFALATAVIGPKAAAQAPTIGRGQMGGVPELRRNESSLGLTPGGGGNFFGDAHLGLAPASKGLRSSIRSGASGSPLQARHEWSDESLNHRAIVNHAAAVAGGRCPGMVIERFAVGRPSWLGPEDARALDPSWPPS